MIDLDKYHAAAKIIRADATAGIRSASKLVGPDVAMAMLVMYLRMEHNRDNGWPDREDTKERVNTYLEGANLLNFA